VRMEQSINRRRDMDVQLNSVQKDQRQPWKPNKKVVRGTSKGDIKCYNCGKRGHYASECRNKVHKKDDRACYVCGQTGHIAKSCSYKHDMVSAVGTPGRLNRTYVTMRIGKGKIKALLDSGADASLIREDVVQAQGLMKEVRPSTMTLISSTNQPHTVVGEINIPVQVQDVTRTLEFAVVKQLPEPIFLGSDSAIKLGLCWDAASKTVTLKAQPQVMSVATSEEQNHEVEDDRQQFQNELLTILSEFPDVVREDDKIGCAKIEPVRIGVNVAEPIAVRPYPLPQVSIDKAKQVVGN